MERAMKAAHGRFDAVRLRTNDAAAARLYEKLGFRRDVGRGDHTHVANLAPELRS